MCDGSYFREDLRANAVLTKYLDDNFYGRVAPPGRFSLERADDMERQFHGIDLVLSNNRYGWTANIDEKSSSHYINSALSNFAFELRTEGRVGWLLDEKMETDYYVLSWVHADTKKFPATRGANDYFTRLREKDIEYFVVCVLKKKDILGYLERCGFTRQRLLHKAGEMIAGKQAADYRWRDKYGFWFRYSKGKLAESPVNVIIRKEVLGRIAAKGGRQACYKVFRDKLEPIAALP